MNHKKKKKSFIRRKSATIRRNFCSKFHGTQEGSFTSRDRASLALGYSCSHRAGSLTPAGVTSLDCVSTLLPFSQALPMLENMQTAAAGQGQGHCYFPGHWAAPRNLLSPALEFLFKLPTQWVPLQLPTLQCLFACLLP